MRMHNLFRRLWQAENAGLTGNGLTYQEFLLSHILEQIMLQKHPPLAVEKAVQEAVENAEANRAEREKALRDS